MYSILSLQTNRHKALFTSSLIVILVLGGIFPGIIPNANAITDAEIVADKGTPGTVFIFSQIESIVTIPAQGGGRLEVGPTTFGAAGSGFFVNSNGYIITNGHVVFSNTESNYLDDPETTNLILIRAAVEWILTREPDADSDRILFLFEFFLENGRIKESTLQPFVVLGEEQAEDIPEKGLKATIVGRPSPFSERDLAILKINRSNTPSLRLGDSDKAAVGQDVFIFGYPGVVDSHPILSEVTRINPTFTKGVISAKRETNFGTPALQTDAAITFGNRGGPALNLQGEVIGVANMGSIADGQLAAGFNFLIASNVVRDYLKENGVDNEPGPIDETYHRGLSFLYAKAHDSAIKEFQAVKQLFEFHWYADELIARSQAAIAAGEIAKSQITLSTSRSTVKFGGSIEVEGNLSHASEMPIPVEFDWEGTEITLTYSGPGGASKTSDVKALKDGTFKDALKLEKVGDWSVIASWQGSKDHSESKSTALLVAISKGTSTVTITLAGTDHKEGEPLTLTGNISPSISGEVTIVFSKPDGSVVTFITTAANGAFTQSYEPDQSGSWSVVATSKGDDSFETSTSQSVTFGVESDITLLLAIAGIVGLAVVGAGVFVWKKRSKPSTGAANVLAQPGQAVKGKFCRQCGATMQPGAGFCRKCGTKTR